jgi:hypothetical protein
MRKAPSRAAREARSSVAVTLSLRAASGFWVQESGCLSAAPVFQKSHCTC